MATFSAILAEKATNMTDTHDDIQAPAATTEPGHPVSAEPAREAMTHTVLSGATGDALAGEDHRVTDRGILSGAVGDAISGDTHSAQGAAGRGFLCGAVGDALSGRAGDKA